MQIISTRINELEIFVKHHPEKVYLFDYTRNLGEIKRILTYVNRFIINVRACIEKRHKKPESIIDSSEIKKNVRKYVPFPTDDEQNEAVKSFIRNEQ